MTAQPDRGTLLLASAAVLASAWCVLPSVTGLMAFGALAALFTAPGWPVARWIAGDGSDAVTRGILALVSGYLAAATVCCVLRLAGVSAPFVVLGSLGSSRRRAPGFCAGRMRASCPWSDSLRRTASPSVRSGC